MILDAKRELGVTSVVISHDIASAFKVADNIAFLYQGVIVDQGPPGDAAPLRAAGGEALPLRPGSGRTEETHSGELDGSSWRLE